MTTNVQNNHWSVDALGEPEGTYVERNILSRNVIRYAIPSLFPESAPPNAALQSTEFGDDDIDDVLSDDNTDRPTDNTASSRNGVAYDKWQPTRSQRMQKKTSVTASVKISLYDRSVADSSYNHLDPSKLVATELNVSILHACSIILKYMDAG